MGIRMSDMHSKNFPFTTAEHKEIIKNRFI